MERSEILTAMAELKLYGMKAAFDEIIGTAVKRQHEPTRIVGDLLTAEITEKQARSIRYRIAIAKLPLAKDLDDFSFDDTPINETLVRELVGGNFWPTSAMSCSLEAPSPLHNAHLAIVLKSQGILLHIFRRRTFGVTVICCAPDILCSRSALRMTQGAPLQNWCAGKTSVAINRRTVASLTLRISAASSSVTSPRSARSPER